MGMTAAASRRSRRSRAFGSLAGNRALLRVLVAYLMFTLTEYAVWIAMLVFAYRRGGTAVAGLVAVAQLVPAALAAPVVAAAADRRPPVVLLAGGYLAQAAAMAATAVAVGAGAPLAAYTAAKHGALGLVRAVSAELAGTGVTVNAVCPGFVDTPMTEATIGNIAQKTGRTAGQARSALEARQRIGRLIMPEEVADAVWFCVASEAVTGQAINVDGGTVQS